MIWLWFSPRSTGPCSPRSEWNFVSGWPWNKSRPRDRSPPIRRVASSATTRCASSLPAAPPSRISPGGQAGLRHASADGPSAMNKVLIDLALQGGGSHGAFAWGVLDRLLEEPQLHIAAISGTSAGAMNVAVLADGWTQGGAEGAREALDKFWQRVSRAAAFSPLQRSPLDRLMGQWTLDTSPAYIAMDLMSRVLSPYDLNPLGFNPLRNILVESIDFNRL